MEVFYGIDFGTTNSAVSIFRDGDTRVLPLDERARTRETYRTLIHVTDSHQVATGYGAIESYLDHGMEGRLIQSIKAFLPSSFNSTQIGARRYRLEELIALFLRQLKARADAAVGQTITRAVFGRPARFSEDPGADALAEARLREAATLAGFKEIQFRLEPIAAAFAYERTLDHPERVLVGDFGGGTSDFTLMDLSPQRRGQEDRRGDIIGTGGVPIAGDRFDAALMDAKVLEHFGRGSTYVAAFNRCPAPDPLFHRLRTWHHLAFLRDRDTRELLHIMERTSDKPAQIAALVDLVEENLGFQLFQEVERTKMALSQQTRATLSFNEARVHLNIPITRGEFEVASRGLVERITTCIDDLFARTEVDPREVDAVFLTGGSSFIPAIRDIFVARFGEAKLRSGGELTRVAEGLCLSAFT